MKATGNPDPKVEWFRGTQTIRNVGRFTLKSDEAEQQCSLVIDDTTLDDAGTYKMRCI